MQLLVTSIYKLVWDKWVELRNSGRDIKFGKVTEIAIEKGMEHVK